MAVSKLKTILSIALLFFIALSSSSADVEERPGHLQPLLDQAAKTIPYVREFRAVFPKATWDVFSRDYHNYLRLTAGLYERYLVTLDFPVKFTADHQSIASWGGPEFELEEIGKINVSEDDQGWTSDGKVVHKLGYDHFRVLKEHDGDFAAIGIDLIRDQPGKNFDRVWMPGPPDYVLRPSTYSPLKRYGVQLLVDKPEGLDDQDDRKNRVVEVRTGRVVTVIHATPGYNRHMNFLAVVPPRWSPDEKLLLWEVAGKWNPTALVLMKIDRGREVWQLDLLTTTQQALLHATKAAAPKKYLAAKKANAGSGSAFPDGFTVNVQTEGEGQKTVSLPLQVYADLDANPKGIENFPANLRSWLDGEVTKNGEFVVKRFHLGSRQ